MLNEILLGLLGFNGDIILEINDTFQVADEFDLISNAEKVCQNYHSIFKHDYHFLLPILFYA